MHVPFQRFQQLSESVQREFVLAPSDGNSTIGFELRIPANIVGNYRLFQPAQMKRFEQRQHAFRVIQRPAHVGVGHHIDTITYGLAHRAHQPDIALHPRSAVGRPPAEPQLHRLVAFVLVALSFFGELVQRHAVQAARIYRNPLLGPTTQQSIHRLLSGFSEQIPQRNVHRADRSHADALPAERHRLAIHVLPQEFNVPRILANQQRLQIEIDHLLADLRSKRRVPDPQAAIVSKNFHYQPSVERERAHRSLRKIEQVHRIRAEMRWQRHRLPVPAHHPRPNPRNLHQFSTQQCSYCLRHASSA